MNCKVPLCHANELNPQKTLHFSPATKGPADMSVILSLTQVWVLTRTRLCHNDWVQITDWKLQKEGDAWNNFSSSVNHGYLQGNTCRRHCFAQKGLQARLQARILLPVRLHLNQTFIGSSRLQGEQFNCCEEDFRAPKKVQQVPEPSPKVDSAAGSGHHQNLLRNGSRQV